MKLRVYYKSSILSHYKYFDVATPQEGKRLIEALNATVTSIIKENDMLDVASRGTYCIGLEALDVSGEWMEWMHPKNGRDIDEVEFEDLIIA